jgi:similar to stage IV sporulation protein
VPLGRLGGWLSGYVLVEVGGKNPERLVNLCLRAGFPVWGFASREGAVFFYTTLPKYREIRKLAQRAKCVPRIRKRVGFPFIIARAKKRPLFLLVGAFMTAVLLYLAGAAWSIQVRGSVSLPHEAILQSAGRAGLFPGARKSAVSTSAVEAAILQDHPDLIWAYVHFQGTLAVIEVVEKTRPESVGPGDVVAAKDGLVKSVLVLSGVPTVESGATVKKGDILIAGTPGDARKGARGNVVANTWYEVYREVPLVGSFPVRTGRKREMKVLRYKTYEITVAGKSNMFEWYEVEDYPDFTLFAGTDRSLQVVDRVFYEVEWVPKELTQEEAARIAEREARRAIERELPSLVKLIDLSCEVEAVQEGIVAVRLVAVAEEDIAVIRPWPHSMDGGR